jgi:LmbE family N-acetylglucosaminyl deacetylase
VSEWYWYSKAHWHTNKLVDTTKTIERKLQALNGYRCQMILTVDEFLGEARAAGMDETQLAGVDATNYQPLIAAAIRTRDAETGAELGTAYAEAFRYVHLEPPAVLAQVKASATE